MYYYFLMGVGEVDQLALADWADVGFWSGVRSLTAANIVFLCKQVGGTYKPSTHMLDKPLI
jgi:hypothetical protein